jgi:Domain of unknown function (DUF4136)
MKTIKKMLSIAIIAMACNACSTYDIASDKDNAVDFSKYKTFAWYAKDPQSFKNNQFDNQIIESNIKNFVSAELKKKGLVVDIDNPDILLDYNLMIQKKTEQVQNPIYSHPYNYGFYNPYRINMTPFAYPPMIVGYRIQNIPYKEGTLTISAVDRNTNKLIWRGWSVGTLTDVQSYESDLHRDIHQILKKYPIAVLKLKNNQGTMINANKN